MGTWSATITRAEYPQKWQIEQVVRFESQRPVQSAAGPRGQVGVRLADTHRMFRILGATFLPDRPIGRSRLRACTKLFQMLVVLCGLAFWLGGRPSLAFDADRLQQQAGRQEIAVQQAVRSLLETIQRASAQPEAARLESINQFFNRRIFFREDTEAWGQVDYWASPLETLARGQGDCEDYAIAKYFSLLAAGVPAARLRLVYVRAMLGPPATPPVAHMVLAYYPSAGADPVILDNLVPEVLPASRRRDLTPVFSFNTDGLWQGTQGNDAGDPLARLSRWREVVAKAREQGFL